jgi:hypothetical protein
MGPPPGKPGSGPPSPTDLRSLVDHVQNKHCRPVECRPGGSTRKLARPAGRKQRQRLGTNPAGDALHALEGQRTPRRVLPRRARLAAHNLRHPLMAHAHDLSDGFHRQAVLVGGANGFVSLPSKGVGGLLQLALAAGVALGECRQTGSGFRCLALGTGNSRGSSVLFRQIG